MLIKNRMEIMKHRIIFLKRGPLTKHNEQFIDKFEIPLAPTRVQC